MHCEAISIGYAVPRTSFDARVHSVFPSAVNLRPARGGRLLTLLAAGETDLPQGIRLDAPAGFTFEGLQPGEEAACRGGILHLERFSLTVDLRRAPRWKCDLPALAADLTHPAAQAAWRTVWNALNARQRRTGAEVLAGALFDPQGVTQSAVAQKIGALVRDLVAAARKNDPAASRSAAGLIGLGGGLTPSGDDILVGFLAGLWCAFGGNEVREAFLTSLGRAIVRLSRRTNDISRTYLYHAAHGQVSSRLADLAGVICRGEGQERLLATAEAAMRAGHASGMEAATGLLAGLVAWAGERTLALPV